MLTMDEYYQAVLETKREFIIDQTKNNGTVHRDSLFDYFEEEFLKLKRTLDVAVSLIRKRKASVIKRFLCFLFI